MRKAKKRCLAAILAALMLVNCVPAAGAAEQTSSTVPLTATVSAPVFSVTVPTTLAVHMNSAGVVTCGNIVITNNGTAPVLVADTQITALNGWTLVDYATTTFTSANDGQHRAAFRLTHQNGVTAAGGNSYQDIIPARGGRQTIAVSAKIPYQGPRGYNGNIAQIVLVLGWHAVPGCFNYTFEVSALNGNIEKRSGSLYEEYYHSAFSSPCDDTFYVSIYDGDGLVQLSPEQQQSIEWYYVEVYYRDQPDPSDVWEYIGSGCEATGNTIINGWGCYIFIKVCWNGYEHMFRISPTGS